jgi:hypothetical protein
MPLRHLTSDEAKQAIGILQIRVGKKHVFFLFKTKHTVFFILNSFFFCLKRVLNLVKKNMF